MKKVLNVGLVVLAIVLSVYLVLKLIDLGIYILDCIFNNPAQTALYTIGLLTLLYIYFKIQDRYRP